MMKQVILVALGGGIGSAFRFLISVWSAKHFPHAFPLGTFIVNITGCFVIGFLMGLSVKFTAFDNELKFLLIAGFCGGYTTFSTFSAESMRLFETENYVMLALYITASIVLGFIALWGGNILSKAIIQ